MLSSSLSPTLSYPSLCPLPFASPLVQEYGSYLNSYAKDFKLDIRFSTPVQCVEPATDGKGYNVTYLRSGSPVTERYDAVAVCSGVHNTPLIPAVKGLDSFAGEVSGSG